MLTGVHHTIELQGIYAECLLRQLAGHVADDDLQRLVMLERQQPWLAGLSEATLQPKELRTTLLGRELGMLFIELTARCNENCIHCYADSTPERTETLTLEEIKAALTAARSMGRPMVQFTGGDPLIHNDLVAAVEFAHGLDFAAIEIYTNGLLLSDKLLQQLILFKPRISFSIYADSADIHDGITRHPGSWQQTLNAMAQAIDAGFDIRAGVVLMPDNLPCAERMPAFLHERLGLDGSKVHFDAIHQVGRGKLVELADSIRVIPSHAPSSGDKRKGKLCIAANGDIYPCIFARHTGLGNIRQQPLAGIASSLEKRQPAHPSAANWNLCKERLSCGDCRIVAYTIGDSWEEVKG